MAVARDSYDAGPLPTAAASRVLAIPGAGVRVADQDAAVVALRERLRPADVVLVTGPPYRTWEVADQTRGPPPGQPEMR